MRIFMSGVSCVGKTTVGPLLAEQLERSFFDMDREIERFHGMKIRPLRRKIPTMREYRVEAAKALVHLLAQKKSEEPVISMPPSGFMQAYWDVIKTQTCAKITLFDAPENILKRLIFFDEESNPKEKTLNKEQAARYLKSIYTDMEYFQDSYNRSDAQVAITGLNPHQAAKKVSVILRVMKKIH